MPTEIPVVSDIFEYRSEQLFSASIVSSAAKERTIQSQPYTLVFSSSNHHKIGIKLTRVCLTLTCPGMTESEPTEMFPKESHLGDNKQKNVFVLATEQLPLPVNITYYVYINETIPNYRYELVDLLCMAQLWFAAKRKQFTDFEFLVGGKIFHAHRVVLAARSPVMAKMFAQSDMEFLRVEDIDVHTFEHFLHFIYTGRLTTSAGQGQLLLAAERFQIDTLKTLCQNAVIENQKIA